MWPTSASRMHGDTIKLSIREPADALKVREIIRQLEENGWVLVRQRGSHRQFKHSEKANLITVRGNLGDEVAPGTLQSILKKSGLKGRL